MRNGKKSKESVAISKNKGEIMVSGFFPILAVASIFYFVGTQLLHSLLGDRAEKTQEEWEEEQRKRGNIKE